MGTKGFIDNAGRAISVANAVGTAGNINTLGTVSSGAVALPSPTNGGPATTKVTISANTTFTLPKPFAGATVKLIVEQDATGSRLATWSTTHGGYVHFPTATSALSVTAAYVDRVVFVSDDGVGWNATLQKHLG